MNNYMSAFDLEQRLIDLDRQKQTSDDLDEMIILTKEIKEVKNRISGVLNQDIEHIIWYD